MNLEAGLKAAVRQCISTALNLQTGMHTWPSTYQIGTYIGTSPEVRGYHFFWIRIISVSATNYPYPYPYPYPYIFTNRYPYPIRIRYDSFHVFKVRAWSKQTECETTPIGGQL